MPFPSWPNVIAPARRKPGVDPRQAKFPPVAAETAVPSSMMVTFVSGIELSSVVPFPKLAVAVAAPAFDGCRRVDRARKAIELPNPRRSMTMLPP